MASQCLQLLQPFVDRHADSTSKEILDSLADSRQWATVCAFMDTQSDIFWAVVLGKKVGIFINRCVTYFLYNILYAHVFLKRGRR